MKNKGVAGFAFNNTSARPKHEKTAIGSFLEASGAGSLVLPYRVAMDIGDKSADIIWKGVDGSPLGTTPIDKVSALTGLITALGPVDRFAFLRMLAERLDSYELELLVLASASLQESRENAKTALPELGADKLSNLTYPTAPPVNNFDGEEDEEDEEDELPDEYEDDEDHEDDDDDEDDKDIAPPTKAPAPPVTMFPIPTTVNKKPGKVSGLKAVKSKAADQVPLLPGNKGTKYDWTDSVSAVFDGAPDESDTVTPATPTTEVKSLRNGKPRGKAR